jgi:hypothetical protein
MTKTCTNTQIEGKRRNHTHQNLRREINKKNKDKKRNGQKPRFERYKITLFVSHWIFLNFSAYRKKVCVRYITIIISSFPHLHYQTLCLVIKLVFHIFMIWGNLTSKTLTYYKVYGTNRKFQIYISNYDKVYLEKQLSKLLIWLINPKCLSSDILLAETIAA